ncbi:MAG: hypothetical protein VB081_00025 [Christensenella sp.]|uniref:hypothetical protein n=1 Tax=Christensenella sp. TaxID=1935934 RepID=UPI002B1F9273|nr:hypothetical protein [Christensenella sp.]MEA5001873.1 hypothetical protein [Christensenella sp.]
MSRPQQDFSRLVAYMEQYPYAAVAFSGGTTSALLVCALYESHGKSAPVITANTPFFTQEEIYRVHEILDDYPKMRSERVAMADLLNIVSEASEDRCKTCAKEVSARLLKAAHGIGAGVLFDGKTTDTGVCSILTGEEQGIRAASPLAELGYTRQDAQDMLRAVGRSYYIRPANDCLACRFAPGETIDISKLDYIESAEKYIRRYTRRGMRVYFDHNKAYVFSEEAFGKNQKQDIECELLLQGKSILVTEVLIQDGRGSFWRDANR